MTILYGIFLLNIPKCCKWKETKKVSDYERPNFDATHKEMNLFVGDYVQFFEDRRV